MCALSDASQEAGTRFSKAKIFETVEVFGLEVIIMRYITAGVFVVTELFDTVAIE